MKINDQKLDNVIDNHIVPSLMAIFTIIGFLMVIGFFGLMILHFQIASFIIIGTFVIWVVGQLLWRNK